MELPTFDYVNRFIRFDPDTGDFYWRINKTSKARAGKKAGSRNERYYNIELDGRRYSAGRVAWLLTHGEWPVHQIDHLNRRRYDNALRNLRDVPPHLNARNKNLTVANTSGVNGACKRVRKDRERYQVRIGVGPRQTVHLGIFDTLPEARAARIAAERLLGYSRDHGLPLDEH